MALRHLILQASRYHHQSQVITKFESRSSGIRVLSTHSHSHARYNNLPPPPRVIRNLAKDLKEEPVRKPNDEQGGGKLRDQLRNKFESIALFFRENLKARPALRHAIYFEPARAELQKTLQYLKDPETFSHLPKSVLLVVPPYTERPILATAIAREAEVPVFACNDESSFQDIFAAAKERSPAVILIDEMDAIGGSKLGSLLVELDGLERNKGIVVIGATSFPRSLENKSLWRKHGRFDQLVVVPNAEAEEGRHQILKYHMSKVVRADDVDDLMSIARETYLLDDANLENLVHLAAVKAKKDGSEAVRMSDLQYAKEECIFHKVFIRPRLFQPLK